MALVPCIAQPAAPAAPLLYEAVVADVEEALDPFVAQHAFSDLEAVVAEVDLLLSSLASASEAAQQHNAETTARSLNGFMEPTSRKGGVEQRGHSARARQ